MMQDKHRHHKQPQHYLNGFAAPFSYQYQKIPDIWVYSKGILDEGLANPRLESTKDVGYTKDFYAFKKDDTVDFNKYENRLMAEFEQPGQPVLDKIRNYEEIRNEEKGVFSRYVGSTITRGDWWRGVGEKAVADSVHQITNPIVKSIQSEDARLRLIKLIAERGEEMKNGELLKASMIKKAVDVSKILNLMIWRFVVAPRGMFFLTSDKPIHYYTLNKPDSELVFPLSSQVILSLSWQRSVPAGRKWKRLSETYWEADDKTVEHARNITCSTAITEIFCCKKAAWLLTFIKNRGNPLAPT